MESTLQALGNLLVEAIPTILFFIFLTVFLQAVLFKPLGRILSARREATEGVRELALQAAAEADKKTSEFERALQAAQAELYKEHEALRRQWEDERGSRLAAARAEAEARIEQSKQELAIESAAAEKDLNAQVAELSNRVVASLLHRKAA